MCDEIANCNDEITNCRDAMRRDATWPLFDSPFSRCLLRFNFGSEMDASVPAAVVPTLVLHALKQPAHTSAEFTVSEYMIAFGGTLDESIQRSTIMAVESQSRADERDT